MTLRSSANLAFLAACATFGLGCEQILGLGDYKESGTGGAHATTSSAQGGGGAASTSGSPTSTSTGMPGVEDCENGVDDDMDQAVDCADTECDSLECVPAIPTGWTFVALAVAPSAPAACPPGYDNQVFLGRTDLQFNPVPCSPCDCAPPVTSCVLKPIEVSTTSSTCGGSLSSYMQSGCVNLQVARSSARANQPTMDISCAPSGGQPGTPPPATWQSDALACTANGIGAGCSGGDACVGDLADPAFRRCIMKEGDNACPAAFAAEKRIATSEPTNLVDTRDCNACTCGAGLGICGASTRIYSTSDCSGTPLTTMSNNNTCVSVAAARSSSIYTTSKSGGFCIKQGGEPNGTVVSGAPTTFCCL